MFGLNQTINKASDIGAFFIVWCFFQVNFFAVAEASDCTSVVAAAKAEQVHVKRVYDGDTVLLTDGRKVRLVGINTPEFNRDGGAHEPMAITAKQALSQLIKRAGVISLHYGRERQDRYKRVLAHLIIDGHINVQQVLLQRGLAFAIVVTPNMWQHACYQQAEKSAREKNLGIWALDYYQPRDVGRQPLKRGGFRLIKGKIKQVNQTAAAVWLNLSGAVSLRISRDDWRYFLSQDWSQWLGREIVVRGWLYRRDNKWRLRLRHPQNITMSAEQD